MCKIEQNASKRPVTSDTRLAARISQQVEKVQSAARLLLFAAYSPRQSNQRDKPTAQNQISNTSRVSAKFETPQG
ncbi:MAG: hypothetical protein ACJA1F_003470 [Paracoccaceae bacterium]|jgi:hypothetical protein